MKKFVIILFCLFITGVTSFSQTKKTPVISPPKQSAVIPVAVISEIPETEWNEIAKALEAENWDKSTLLSSIALKRLKTENKKRQIAGLNYFYLFSLAGKVQAKTATYAEFEKISQAFIGKEFMMPVRQILADCTEKINYICPVKTDEMSLRVTATNKSATAINLFEYVRLDEPFDFSANNERRAFLSGKLTKVESNLKNGMRLIRLFFEEGKAEMAK
jgi:hypothetical protein